MVGPACRAPPTSYQAFAPPNKFGGAAFLRFSVVTQIRFPTEASSVEEMRYFNTCASGLYGFSKSPAIARWFRPGWLQRLEVLQHGALFGFG